MNIFFLFSFLVIKVTPEMFALNLPNINRLEAHFLMCNPPFFNDRSFDYNCEDSESCDEPMTGKKSSSHRKSGRPSPSNLTIPIESVTLGGEVEFVKKIIGESLILKESIKIYTVMLGHKRSSITLREHLKTINEVKDVTVNQFYQGRTLRWGLAWTFLEDIKLSESIKFSEMKKQHKKKNPPLTYSIPKNITSINYSLQSIYRWIRHLLRDELEISTVDIIRESNQSIEMIIRSQVNSWSHQRRRKRMAARSPTDESNNNQEINPIDLKDEINEMEMDDDCNVASPSGTIISTQSDESFTNDSNELKEISNPGKRKAQDTIEEEENCHEETKKIRDQRQFKSIVKEEELYLLHCSLTIKRTENNFIILEMRTKEKAKSKDSTNQLLTFFKNNIN